MPISLKISTLMDDLKYLQPKKLLFSSCPPKYQRLLDIDLREL